VLNPWMSQGLLFVLQSGTRTTCSEDAILAYLILSRKAARRGDLNFRAVQRREG
jgi:hypothetical protein